MCRARGQLRVHAGEERHPLGDEASEHGVGEPGSPFGPQQPRPIDRRVHGLLRHVARVLDLVGGHRQQRPQRAREARRMGEEGIDRRCEAQVPAQGSQRDGANGRPVGGVRERGEGRVRGVAV